MFWTIVAGIISLFIPPGTGHTIVIEIDAQIDDAAGVCHRYDLAFGVDQPLPASAPSPCSGACPSWTPYTTCQGVEICSGVDMCTTYQGVGICSGVDMCHQRYIGVEISITR